MYDHVPLIDKDQGDTIGHWHKVAQPSTDKDDVVANTPKYPLLLVLAPVYLGVGSTSGQLRRDSSALEARVTKFRCSLKTDRVELRLNADSIRV